MSTDRYSWPDRLVHHFAFSSLDLQKEMAAIENRVYAAALNRISVRPSVFIASLPRAGTTLLLEIIARAPGFASNTYRDMPFLLCPLFWDTISGRFRREAKPGVRPHQDGIEVGYDSPEAFEEVVWRFFFPDHYQDGTIRPWIASEEASNFREFLLRHMRKIIALRLGGVTAKGRYVSKNNTNISRLALLRRLFPDSQIIVPFRNPSEQARSLLRQHRRFLEMHARSCFARQYMNWLGHFEFGMNLMPIAFPGLNCTDLKQAQRLDFWLRYWIASFAQILREDAPVILLSYERLCIDPGKILGELAKRLDEPLDAFSQGIRRVQIISPPSESTDIADPDLILRAEAIHTSLMARAI